MVYDTGMNPLKRLREDKGLLQSELAALMGVCQQQVSYWERKFDMRDITTRNLIKISDALGTNVVGLLTERRSDRIDAVLGESDA